ncbi:MAG TPA: SWIM zinc finger family protein, partial [Acidimicrobiales bacterium]|nr:SWIM zinc finger family protein [Acidimicrobiales bacterium]
MSWDEGYWPERRRRLPGPGPARQGRRGFGTSWWGKAWVQAIEGRARLDPNRLPRGRTYARTGAVGTLALAPGEVRAAVQGSRRTPYDVRVRVRAFTEAEWGRVLDALGDEIGRTAALLDGELPPEVASDVAKLGLDLLPGPGEVQPRCSCPDFADPCKHGAAVCYLVADALDDDPFGVLLLRGMGREEVLAGLRARRRGVPAQSPARRGDTALGRAAEEDAGVPARAAWQQEAAAPLPSLPFAPPLPLRPGAPTVLAADPPAETGLELAALRALAADASARALAVARGAGVAVVALDLDVGQDLARRAALLIPDGGDGGQGGGAHDGAGVGRGGEGGPGGAGSARRGGGAHRGGGADGAGAGGERSGGLPRLARRAGIPASELFAR